MLDFNSSMAHAIILHAAQKMREAGGFMLVLEIENLYKLSREDAVIVRNSAEHDLQVEGFYNA